MKRLFFALVTAVVAVFALITQHPWSKPTLNSADSQTAQSSSSSKKINLKPGKTTSTTEEESTEEDGAEEESEGQGDGSEADGTDPGNPDDVNDDGTPKDGSTSTSTTSTTVSSAPATSSSNPPAVIKAELASGPGWVASPRPGAPLAAGQVTTTTMAPAPTTTVAPTATSVPVTTAAPKPKPVPTTQAPNARKIIGSVVSSKYGDTQVAIVVRNGVIVSVEVPVSPHGDATSAAISNSAIPQLKSATLRSQSANIANISGATYTVAAFTASLQTALSRI